VPPLNIHIGTTVAFARFDKTWESIKLGDHSRKHSSTIVNEMKIQHEGMSVRITFIAKWKGLYST
jgi:hypothetical protein